MLQVKVLLELGGVDPKLEALVAACANGHIDVVGMLIDDGSCSVFFSFLSSYASVQAGWIPRRGRTRRSLLPKKTITAMWLICSNASQGWL